MLGGLVPPARQLIFDKKVGFMKVDGEKPLLVNVGCKLSPQRALNLSDEARERGITVSELIRWLVDEHYSKSFIKEQVRLALAEFHGKESLTS